MSAFEIHCELARDLLAPVSSERDKDDRGDHDLEVAKDGSVHGLTARPVASRKQFEGFLAEATRRRAGSAWRRSHVVVRLVLTRFPRGEAAAHRYRPRAHRHRPRVSRPR